jgi:hypothetical protein
MIKQQQQWTNYNMSPLNKPNQQGNPREKIPNMCQQFSALEGNLIMHKPDLEITL